MEGTSTSFLSVLIMELLTFTQVTLKLVHVVFLTPGFYHYLGKVNLGNKNEYFLDFTVSSLLKTRRAEEVLTISLTTGKTGQL